jgi:hypothetical protein
MSLSENLKSKSNTLFKGVNDIQKAKNALVNFGVGYYVSESKPSTRTALLHTVLNICVSVLREFVQFICT